MFHPCQSVESVVKYLCFQVCAVLGLNAGRIWRLPRAFLKTAPCLEDWSGYSEPMIAEIDVKTLSKVEKLRLIETLWADLSAEDIASPRWHQDALLEAERLHAEGKATFSEWSEAKERIRAAVSAR